jgi:hypothetical protein
MANLRNLWPGRQKPWRKRHRHPRQPGLFRAFLAGALFGLTLAVLEPPFVILLGADPATWSGPAVIEATAVSAAVCGLVGLLVPSGADARRGPDKES